MQFNERAFIKRKTIVHGIAHVSNESLEKKIKREKLIFLICGNFVINKDKSAELLCDVNPLVYDSECRTISAQMKRKLDAVEMYFYNENSMDEARVLKKIVTRRT